MDPFVAVLAALAAFLAGAGLAYWISAGRALASLRKKLRQQGALMNGAAQQLRTPLNEVLGLVQTLHLRAGDFPTENRELIETLAGSGAVAKAVLLDVLDILDLESGQLRIKPRVELLPEVMRFIRRAYRQRAEQEGVDLDIDVRASARAWFLFDDLRVRQCIAAMVRQSLAQSAGGAVKVGLEVVEAGSRSKERLIVATVRDSSPGLDQHVAETYFSARHFTQNKYLMGGTVSPLSLVVARMLARRMGGDLTVESAPGEGVAFRLVAPAKFVRGANEESSAADLTPFDVATRYMRDRVALIVEDNNVNLRVIEAFLKRVQPKKILTAHDGEEALRILEAEECGVVLMDTHMPVMDGLVATRRIRASDAAWRNIPIIAVSAAATGDEMEACFNAGADAFLAKPISPEALYEKIVRVCAE